MIHRLLRYPGIALAAVIGLLFIMWSAGALWYDLSVSGVWRKAAAGLLIVATAILWLSKSKRMRMIACALPFLIAAWWFTLKPSNHRRWLPDVAETPSAEFDGDKVVLHNVRNFNYRTEADYTPHWETRTVNLSKITGIDMAINYWGSPYMAHPVVSFQFSNAPPVCFSIETRKEIGERYSAIGGIYRQFELVYIVSDERDVIRVRTNYREGEDIYLYRLNITPENARVRFMEYVNAMNRLHETPRWYNALTTNCTTGIRTQHAADKRQPWDWRILVNGKGDEMLYERGAIRTAGLPFTELKKTSLINSEARAADSSPDFSQLIRANLPAFRPSTN